MYSLPSTSQIREPSPRSTTTGSPPTPRNARTGEFTPPGNNERARDIISDDRMLAAVAADGHLLEGKLSRRSATLWGAAWQNGANERSLEVVIIHDFLDRDFCESARRQGF